MILVFLMLVVRSTLTYCDHMVPFLVFVFFLLPNASVSRRFMRFRPNLFRRTTDPASSGVSLVEVKGHVGFTRDYFMILFKTSLKLFPYRLDTLVIKLALKHRL